MPALFLLGVAGSIILEATGWDLGWTAAFYEPGGTNNGWIHGREKPWSLLYDYGAAVGVVLLLVSLAGYVAARLGRIRGQYSKPCLVVILTIVIGPGVLVNGVLKNYWGRPRPQDVTIFGGQWEYRPVWQPGVAGSGKSFTCGHCAAAVSVASLAAFYPYHPVAATAALAGGILYGGIMGVARIAQGGHFPTDVLWSVILVLMVTAGLYYVVFRLPEEAASSGTIRAPDTPTMAVLIAAFFVVPGVVLLLRSPFYHETSHLVDVPKGVREISLRARPESVETRRHYFVDVRRVTVGTVVRGFGAPWARVTESVTSRREGRVLYVYYDLITKGYVGSSAAQATLILPARME